MNVSLDRRAAARAADRRLRREQGGGDPRSPASSPSSSPRGSGSTPSRRPSSRPCSRRRSTRGARSRSPRSTRWAARRAGGRRRPVAFLASDDAAWITGQTLVVDGGLSKLGGRVRVSRLPHGCSVAGPPSTATPPRCSSRVEVPLPEPGAGQRAGRGQVAALNFPDVLLAQGAVPGAPRAAVHARRRVVRHDRRPWARASTSTASASASSASPALPHGALGRVRRRRRPRRPARPAGLDDAAGRRLLPRLPDRRGSALHRRAGLRAGETLLVHAAAGGVGSAAVQLGQAAGARVVAVVGGAVQGARRGGSAPTSSSTGTRDDVVAAVRAATGPGAPTSSSTRSAAPRSTCRRRSSRSRAASSWSASPRARPAAAASHALVKNYSILGLHWGLYRSKGPALVRRCHEELLGLVSAGAVQPLVADQLPFAGAPAGLARLASGAVVGRLTVAPPR